MAFLAADVTRMITSAFESGRLAHGYLISGAEGSGTETVAAALVAAALDRAKVVWPPPAHPDLLLVEPESKSRRIVIEQIRGMEQLIRLRPSVARRKVGVIVDADRLQPQAANAFLKTLEEPPPDSLLVLTTTNSEGVLGTILSRCIRIPLRMPPGRGPAAGESMAPLLDRLLAVEQFSIPAVLGLVRAIEEVWAKNRGEVLAAAELRLREEKKAWPEGAPADVLKARDEQFKAAAEARYLMLRSAHLDAISAWWVAAARSLLVSPEAAPKTIHRMGMNAILAMIDEIEKLRDNLGRNVQEGLALETAFLSLCTDS